MANRYWVGGTANWDGTAGSKWSTTSGGSGGSAVPTSSDDVFFDAASGAGTCTITASANAKTLTFTGYTGTWAGSAAIAIAGNLTMGSGMTNSYTGQISFGSGLSIIITSNGKTFASNFLDIDSNVTLGDDFVTTGDWTVQQNFNDGGFNFKAKSFGITGIAKTMTASATTWEFTGDGTPFTTGTATGANKPVLAFNSAHVLKFTSSSGNQVTVALNQSNSFPAYTLGTVWFARGASTALIKFEGNLTMTGLKDTGTAAHSIKFSTSIEGASYTISDATKWVITGSSGNLISLISNIAGSFTFSIVCTSGTISSDYVSIAWSAASGGASFYAGANSTNGGNNSGWIFTAPPSGPTNLKSYNTNLKANIKSINTNPIANIKSLNTNT